MKFTVTVVQGDEPFKIRFGTTAKAALDLIRQSYPDITGNFRLITTENGIEDKVDLGPDDLFPEDNNGNARVVFISRTRQAPPKQGK